MANLGARRVKPASGHSLGYVPVLVLRILKLLELGNGRWIKAISFMLIDCSRTIPSPLKSDPPIGSVLDTPTWSSPGTNHAFWFDSQSKLTQPHISSFFVFPIICTPFSKMHFIKAIIQIQFEITSLQRCAWGRLLWALNLLQGPNPWNSQSQMHQHSKTVFYDADVQSTIGDKSPS